MSDLLIFSISIPLLIALLLLVLPRRTPEFIPLGLGLAGFLVPAVISVRVFLAYLASGATGFAFVSDIDTGLSDFGISLKLGVNGISAPLYMMAGVVGFAAGLAAVYSVAERKRTYLVLLLIMQSGLMGVFSTYDLFYLYFFHEFALIPTFIMVAIWGGTHRRAAAMEMTVYLTLGAMLSLVGLIGIYVENGLRSFDLVTLSAHVAEVGLPSTLQKSLFGLLMVGLGILVALFPFHSWAPRGYGAAPTSAAMLHAGVLKKFGLYLMIQVALPLLGTGAVEASVVLAVLALGNLLYIGLVTMAQQDLKQLVSYGSVMHMGYIFLGIASLGITGVSGAVFLMVAHGFSVALLFNLSVAVQHRCRTFYLDEMGGLGRHAPVLGGFLMAAMMASIGLPGFATFWGELTIFVSLWEWNPLFLVLALLGIIISAVYGLRAVAAIVFGPHTEAFQKVIEEHPVSDLKFHERLPAVILLAALLILGFFPGATSRAITATVDQHIINPSHVRHQTVILESTPADLLIGTERMKEPELTQE